MKKCYKGKPQGDEPTMRWRVSPSDELISDGISGVVTLRLQHEGAGVSSSTVVLRQTASFAKYSCGKSLL